MPAFIALILLLLLVTAAGRNRKNEAQPRQLGQQEFDRLAELVGKNRQVEAIREYRRLTGASLQQATDWVGRLK